MREGEPMEHFRTTERLFIWCPNCGIHNYWDDKGDHLECEDCHYVLRLPKKKIALMRPDFARVAPVASETWH